MTFTNFSGVFFQNIVILNKKRPYELENFLHAAISRVVCQKSTMDIFSVKNYQKLSKNLHFGQRLPKLSINLSFRVSQQ